MATEKQQPTQFLLYPGLYPPEAGMGSDYVYLLLIPQNFHFLTRYMVGLTSHKLYNTGHLYLHVARWLIQVLSPTFFLWVPFY